MAIKIKSKLPTKQESKLEPKLEVKEIYPDFIDDDGYVNKYDYDGGLYYTTSISMKGPKGNPGPPGRMGKDGITPHINPENHHWMIGDIDTGVNAERTSIVVDTLPTPSEETKDLIYVAPSEHTETGDIYSEYVTVYKNGAYSWEKMGTPIDMSHVVFWEDTQQLVEPTDYDPQTLSEPKTKIQTFSGNTLNAELSTYYKATSDVNTLTVTLPTVTDVLYTRYIYLYVHTGNNPNITFSSADTVSYFDGYELLPNTTYELEITYNKNQWVVSHKIGVTEELYKVMNTVLGMDEIPSFDSTESYSIDDFVMYDNKLYKFITAHTGNWDSSDVIETSLVEEIDNMVKSDYEEAIITLQDEQDTPMASVDVAVQVEGEQSARNLTTDSNGRCTTNIQKGLEYTISCNNVTGYLPVVDVIKRASLPNRNIIITYIADDTATSEHLQVTINYSLVVPQTPIDHIIVTYGGENHSVSVSNNIAETDILIGTTYTISFPSLNGYYSPRNLQYVASYHGNRPITATYHYLSEDLVWLMKDNTTRSLNGLTVNDEDDIFGLVVRPSDLLDAGAAFVIPYRYVRGLSITTGLYLNAYELIPGLGQYQNHASALANDKNGESNCQKILDYIDLKASQGVTRTSSMVTNCKQSTGDFPTFDINENYTQGQYIIYNSKIYLFTTNHSAGAWNDNEATEIGYGWLMPDGVIRQCFTPSYALIYAFRLNRDAVDSIIYGLYEHNAVLIGSNEWWTSTQYNADGGVLLSNGSFHHYPYSKTYAYLLLPVLAY